jgi:hypothetical protein
MAGCEKGNRVVWKNGRQAISESCIFPHLDGLMFGPRECLTTQIELKHCQDLLDIWVKSQCNALGILSTAWALVLRCYTGINAVCFGYQDDREGSAATRSNTNLWSDMSVWHVILDKHASLAELTAASRGILVRGQQNSRAEASGGTVSRKLFNTAMFSQTSSSPSKPFDLEALGEVSVWLCLALGHKLANMYPVCHLPSPLWLAYYLKRLSPLVEQRNVNRASLKRS